MLTKKKFPVEKKINLDVFKNRTEYELRYLKNYIVDIGEAISDKAAVLEGNIFSDLDSNPDDEEILLELFQKELFKLKSYFYHSSLVLVYTLLESSFSNLCSEINEFTNSRLIVKDLSDNNLIRKSLKYIELICDVDLKKEKKLYDRICEYQQLRNQIVHQNSKVKGNSIEALAKNAKILSISFSGIEINGNSWEFHILSNDLIIELVQIVEDFIYIAIEKIESQVFLLEK